MKQAVELPHLARCDAEKSEVGVAHADSLDQPVQSSFRVLPDLVRGSPEDDHGVAVGAVQELVGPSDDPEHAGVGHHPQSRPAPYVRLVAQRRGVVHADHALCVVDLVPCLSSQDVAGAGHQCTAATVQVHALKIIN